MNHESISRIVGTDRVPQTARALSTLDRLDYADSYTLMTGSAGEASAERWSRTFLERTTLGSRARLLWLALGLELGPSGSPDHVQGWRIADHDDGWIRLATTSWWSSGEVICLVDHNSVTVALFLRYRSPLAGPLWAFIAPLHQRAVPAMMRQGLRACLDARGEASREHLGVR